MQSVKIQAAVFAAEGEMISLWRTAEGFEIRSKFWVSPIPVPIKSETVEAGAEASNRAHGLFYENLGAMYHRKAEGKDL